MWYVANDKDLTDLNVNNNNKCVNKRLKEISAKNMYVYIYLFVHSL